MRHVVMLCAATAALLSLGSAQGADTYAEPPGSGSFGQATPPAAGTQEYAFDSFGNVYYFDNATAGRTIGGQPLIDFSGNNGGKQIQPILRSNAGGGGDVDLFQVSVTQPNLFQAWT